MKFLTLLLILLPLQVFAKNVEIKIKSTFEKEGVQKIAESTMIVAMDKKFEIPFQGQDSLKIKMTTSQDISKANFPNAPMGKDLVFFDGEIYSLENGKEKLVSTPKVITKFGEKATMSSETKGEMFQIELVVKRVL